MLRQGFATVGGRRKIMGGGCVVRESGNARRRHLQTGMDFYCEQVLSGRVPVQRLAETEHVLAFHHTQPYWPVHIVIIPKRHIESLAALDEADLPIVHEMLTL